MDHNRNSLSMETVADLQEFGFKGFLSVKNLRIDLRRSPRHPSIPTTGGIYLVIREREEYPEFLSKGTGGKIGRRDKNGNKKYIDPNVDISELTKNWVEGALILYVGRSGNLQRRICQLIKFGNGETIPHGGGRYLWQIADAEDFKVCWKLTPGENQKKRDLLEKFERTHHGRRPFAKY